jgi:hypothetical protein
MPADAFMRADAFVLDVIDRTPVDGEGLITPEGMTVDDFQLAAASAQAFESAGRIEILEERVSGPLIRAIRFRRLT